MERDAPVVTVTKPGSIQPRLFNVDEYYQMASTGILHPTERVELVDGHIVNMPPQGPLHAATVSRVVRYLLSRLTPEAASIRTEQPISINELGEPIPDITVVRPDLEDNDYAAHHPQPEDILLLIEVADSSLEYDRNTKDKLYSRAGILEYWIIDLKARQLRRYTGCTESSYREEAVLVEGEVVSPIAFPALTISISELFTRKK